MKYRINVAKAHGMNWNNTEPQYYHLFHCEFDDKYAANSALLEIKERFSGDEFQITLSVIPCGYSTEVNDFSEIQSIEFVKA